MVWGVNVGKYASPMECMGCSVTKTDAAKTDSVLTHAGRPGGGVGVWLLQLQDQLNQGLVAAAWSCLL